MQTRLILAPMPLVSSVRNAYRKLLGRGPYDPQKLDDAKRRDKLTKQFPNPDWNVNVERDFRKPRP
jgi:hypothetical protein